MLSAEERQKIRERLTEYAQSPIGAEYGGVVRQLIRSDIPALLAALDDTEKQREAAYTREQSLLALLQGEATYPSTHNEWEVLRQQLARLQQERNDAVRVLEKIVRFDLDGEPQFLTHNGVPMAMPKTVAREVKELLRRLQGEARTP